MLTPEDIERGNVNKMSKFMFDPFSGRCEISFLHLIYLG